VSAGRFFRWGLLLVLVALGIQIFFHTHRRVSEEALDRWSDHILLAAGALLVIAVVLWVMDKAGLLVSGARCKDCKRRVPFNHLYCLDHLRARTDAAREKYRYR
jgi:hypothetical protein